MLYFSYLYVYVEMNYIEQKLMIKQTIQFT